MPTGRIVSIAGCATAAALVPWTAASALGSQARNATPAARAPAIRLTAGRHSIDIEQHMTLHVRLRRPFDRAQPVTEMVALAPFTQYVATVQREPARDGTAVLPVLVPAQKPGLSGLVPPDRNFRVYVTDGMHRSWSLFVRVYDRRTLTSTRSGDFLTLRAFDEVHWLPQYPQPFAYFYTRPTGAKLPHLVGRRRMHPLRPTRLGEILTASVTFFQNTGGTGTQCFIHPTLPDMGRPYTNRPCGRPTLSG